MRQGGDGVMECQSDGKEPEREYEHTQEQEGRRRRRHFTPLLRALFLEHPGIFAPATLR